MSASFASAVPSSRIPTTRKGLKLKPLPLRKDLIRVGEDSSTNFQEGFVLPNTPYQYE
jgi:hypothetical protein